MKEHLIYFMYFLYSWLDQVIAIKEDIISQARPAQHQLSIMTGLAVSLKVVQQVPWTGLPALADQDVGDSLLTLPHPSQQGRRMHRER